MPDPIMPWAVVRGGLVTMSSESLLVFDMDALEAWPVGEVQVREVEDLRLRLALAVENGIPVMKELDEVVRWLTGDRG